jgi:hypothetical protein
MDHPEVDRFLDEWHRIIREQDIAAIVEILADDVEIGAPPYWNKLEGKELVGHLLGLILETIEEFTYHRQWRSGRELALEFTGVVDGHQLQGVDLITVNEEGLLAKIDVPMRPLGTIEHLRDKIGPKMQKYLASL